MPPSSSEYDDMFIVSREWMLTYASKYLDFQYLDNIFFRCVEPVLLHPDSPSKKFAFVHDSCAHTFMCKQKDNHLTIQIPICGFLFPHNSKTSSFTHEQLQTSFPHICRFLEHRLGDYHTTHSFCNSQFCDLRIIATANNQVIAIKFSLPNSDSDSDSDTNY